MAALSKKPQGKTQAKTPAKKPGSEKGVERIVRSYDWYERTTKFLMKVVLWLGLYAMVMTGLAFVSFMFKPSPVYFASTPDLRLAPMVPLNQPMMNDAGLSNWASKVVSQSLSFGFTNWQRELQGVRSDFTPPAFSSFYAALKNSGLLDKVLKERIDLTATSGSVVIANRGMLGGKYAWLLKMKVHVTFEGSGGTLGTQDYNAKVTVQRVSTAEHPRGVQIVSINLE